MHKKLIVTWKFIEDQLEPFYCNLKVKECLIYTKEEILNLWKKSYNKMKEDYEEFLKNPTEYKIKYQDFNLHLNFIEYEFPKMLNYTEEDIYNLKLKDFKNSNGYYRIDKKSWDVYSRINPNSKYDYYDVWGRFLNTLIIKEESEYEEPNFESIQQIFDKKEDFDKFKKEIIRNRKTDVAKIKDIDFEKMHKEDIEFLKEKYNNIKNKEKEKDLHLYCSDEEFNFIKNNTIQEYIKEYSKNLSIWCYAILHKWQWIEFNEKIMTKQEWLKTVKDIIFSLDREELITIIDYHY